MNEPHKYTCAVCGGDFVTSRPQKEAEAELAEKFPGFAKDQCDEVCDECWKSLPCSVDGWKA